MDSFSKLFNFEIFAGSKDYPNYSSNETLRILI